MEGELYSKYCEVISSINYDENAFTVWYGHDKVLVGAFLKDSPEAQDFLNYGTIHNAVLNLDKKIKYSLKQALFYADNTDFESWRPFDPPSENEQLSIYFSENAMYRIASLWDLLAQFYNIKEKVGKMPDQIHSTSFFNNLKKDKNTDPAKRIANYMQEKDGFDEHGCPIGNYEYLKDYRNKMTHRISPSMTSISELSVELRMPMVYVLTRVISDYWQVSSFLKEIISNILANYKALDGQLPKSAEE